MGRIHSMQWACLIIIQYLEDMIKLVGLYVLACGSARLSAQLVNLFIYSCDVIDVMTPQMMQRIPNFQNAHRLWIFTSGVPYARVPRTQGSTEQTLATRELLDASTRQSLTGVC